MYPPSAARTTSRRRLNSSQTPVRVPSYKKFTAAVILPLRSTRPAANSGTKKSCLWYNSMNRSLRVRGLVILATINVVLSLGVLCDPSKVDWSFVQKTSNIAMPMQCCCIMLKDEFFKVFTDLGKKPLL